MIFLCDSSPVMRLNNLVKSRILKFLGSLAEFKTNISREDVFSSVLASVQRDYLVLMTLLNKSRKVEGREMRKVDTINEITRYTFGSFGFLYHTQYGVLSVSVGDPNINNHILCSARKHALHGQLEVMNKMLEMYLDYEKTNCDFCGEYTTVPGFATPTGRSVEEDFVLAYHPVCKENYIGDF